MQIGRRIYYEKATGNIILDKGEMNGYFVPTTVEQDIENFTVLSERNIDSYGFIELSFGQYRQDFMQCQDYRVNIETLDLEFNYSPNEPKFEKALTVQVEELRQEQASTNLTLLEMMEAIFTV